MQFNRHLKFKAWVKDEVKDAFRKRLDREMFKAWVKAWVKSIESPPDHLSGVRERPLSLRGIGSGDPHRHGCEHRRAVWWGFGQEKGIHIRLTSYMSMYVHITTKYNCYIVSLKV